MMMDIIDMWWKCVDMCMWSDDGHVHGQMMDMCVVR